MRIIIDVREHSLIEKIDFVLFENTKYKTKMDISKEALDLGDVSIRNDSSKEILIIERKSLADLLSSIKDGRYDEQSHRLIHSSGLAPHRIYYIVEGLLSQISEADKRIVFSAMTSLSYFKGFSVVRTRTGKETAELVLAMVYKIGRELVKMGPELVDSFSNSSNSLLSSSSNSLPSNSLPSNSLPSNSLPSYPTTDDPPSYNNFVKKVKRDNITPQNIGEIMLSQIPGVSPIVAHTILAKFRNFPHFIAEMQEKPDCLLNMTIESNGKVRKISKTVIKSIEVFLVGTP